MSDATLLRTLRDTAMKAAREASDAFTRRWHVNVARIFNRNMVRAMRSMRSAA
jgi:hypothetical protein